jgi:hypothetical protein
MTKRKLWTYLAAGSALAIALSSAALGANSTDSNGDATIPAALGHAASVTDKASSVANAVLEALTGGSNPSTTASNANATTEHATNTNKDETTDTNVSAGQESSPAGTTGTKPGWGCGDDNHTHSGPPGRPGATPPPGCAKSH